VATGAWRHVAGVFDGSQMRVYVGGVMDGSVSTTSGPGSGTGAFYIGRHSTSYSPYYFGGLIDEVRVSAAALYSSNFTPGLGAGSNVRGLWKFDGQTPNDFSGNGNNGTLQNTPTYSTDVPSSGSGSQRPAPVAGGPYSGQVAQAVSFSSSGSFDPDGTIISYLWNFGDGATASTANPSHAYATPGLYTATLTVTDNAGLLASATTVVTISNNGNARLDPLNQTGGSGENPLSQNFNWTLPLVGLQGRAGMDLNLSLSYNSLVWTRNGSYISFDDDRGFPTAGFRLGFPVIQPVYYNSEVGKNAFLLIGSDGSRTELRQVGASTLYEAADSSYLLLDANTMVLRTTDGTQLKYAWKGSEYNCTEVKDRNGNYITVNYNSFARVDAFIDTLGRVIRFNYDANGLLTSITQIWNEGTPSQSTHNWATFEYSNTTIQTTFSGLTVSGPSNGSTIKTLSRVRLSTGARYDFSYTSWGQVWKITGFAADEHQLNYRAYKLPGSPLSAETPGNDCPRFTERRDWAENWNQNVSGVEQEAITAYATPTPDSWTMPDGTAQSGMRADVTAPDGTTVNKIYFMGVKDTASGWRRGLPALVNTYSSGVLQRQMMTTWTQDNTSVSYPLNPRLIETNTYDPAGNRARVQTTYQQFTFANGTSCQLPRDMKEYAANATTVLRSTRTDYHSNAVYTDRRIIGLVTEKRLYEGDVDNGGVLKSKVGFFYDNENSSSSIQGNDAPVQHDNTSYTASFVTGRANLSSVRRYDVDNTAQFTTTRSTYNTAGAVFSMADAANHTTQRSYIDSFSDGVSRNTLAYPTMTTDPDGYSSTAKYNFDFGAVTYNRTPQPNTTQNLPGPEQTLSYDNFGRLLQTTNVVNGAYTRYEYPTSNVRVDTYRTIQQGLGEAHSFEIKDGMGRVIATAMDHPGSVGGYSGQKFVYNVMGQVTKTSNPTETNASGAPSQWAAAGDDAAAGWLYTEQSYDWKGRPLTTTNPDLTTKTASYAGCGCAGGQVVTLTDEGTLDGGIAKRRQQKIYSDVLGRTVKTEVYNWQGGSVYSTTVTSYNVRDQIMQSREYAGVEGSGTYQETTLAYDGYGRLQSRHVPEQDIAAATVWTYNADDTVNTVTDARGASQSYAYNNRHLPTSIAYGAPAGSGIALPAQVILSYDGAGNRVSMIDTFGTKSYQYDLLSRLTQETRGLPIGTYSINYSYNLAGRIASITDPFGANFSYTRDLQGRMKTVTGSPYAGVTNYVNGVEYRAWGAPKSVAYEGNSSTIAFNARLQPTQFRLTANGTGASIIRENYSYFADGRLATVMDLDDSGGSNPPATLRFLSRSYSYDHVGRSTGGQGTGIATMPAVPYSQSYSYDQFGNMTVRSGAYYVYSQSPPSSADIATYSNNRRSNWNYNADGQVISTPSTSTDLPRTMTYDAAGRMRTTTQSSQSGTVTYSATYDGDGQLVHEVNTSSGSSTTAYIVRSTVLDGEVLTRLDQSGNKLTTHVPAEGLLFSTQSGSLIVTTYRDPLGITETSLGVYDPLGNYIPYRPSGSPQPPIGSYNSGSMSGLGSSLSNANNYALGCVMDGLPTNCKLVGQAIARGQAKSIGIMGLALIPQVTRLMSSFTATGAEFRTVAGSQSKSTTVELAGGYGFTWSRGVVELWTHYIIAPGLQLGFEQNPQKPSAEPVDPRDVRRRLLSNEEMGYLRHYFYSITGNEDCAKFIEDFLNKAAELNPQHKMVSDDIRGMFESIASGGGFWSASGASYNTIGGDILKNSGAIYFLNDPRFYSFGRPNRKAELAYLSVTFHGMAQTAIHELMHHAGFGDRALANTAAFLRKENVSFANNWEGTLAASKYWNTLLDEHCQ